VRLRHFATALAFKPCRAARRGLDQLIRALGSVKAVAEDSCTNPSRTAAVARAITVTAKHAIMKTRTIFLQPPQQNSTHLS